MCVCGVVCVGGCGWCVSVVCVGGVRVGGYGCVSVRVCVGGGWEGGVCVCNLSLPVYFAQRLSCIRVIQNL